MRARGESCELLAMCGQMRKAGWEAVKKFDVQRLGGNRCKIVVIEAGDMPAFYVKPKRVVEIIRHL